MINYNHSGILKIICHCCDEIIRNKRVGFRVQCESCACICDEYFTMITTHCEELVYKCTICNTSNYFGKDEIGEI